MLPGYSPIGRYPIGASHSDWSPVPAAALSGDRGITYTCTMIETGYSDLDLPMRSFSLRLRQSPAKCYMSVQIPNVLDYIDDIEDRIAGEVRIDLVQGDTVIELLTANVYEFRYDQGGLNRSGGITAYKQKTFPSVSVDVDHPSYKRVSGGVTTYRSPPVASLKPSCTAVVNGQSIIVDHVSWSVSHQNRVMEFADG